METVRDGQPGTIKLKHHPRSDDFFIQLIARQPVDRWERVRRNELLFHYGRYLGLVRFTGDPIGDRMQKSFSLVEGSYACLLGMASVVLDNGNSSNWGEAAAWLAKAETLKYEALKKKSLAQLYYLKGSLLQKQGQENAAIRSFRMSLDIYPHPENTSSDALDQYRIDFKRVKPPGPKSSRSGLPLPR